jgi:hypothetical protein
MSGLQLMTESKNTAECLGRQQAFAIVVNQCSAAQAECLKELHDSRTYQTYGLTWEQFCDQHAGVSRAQADRIISQLEEFGQNFFRLAQLTRISPATYRQLNPHIEDEIIEIDGEKIPLNPDNTPRLRAAVQRYRAQIQKTRTDAEAHEASIIALTDRARALVEVLDKRSTLVLPDGEYAALKGLIEFTITNFTRLRHKYARRH